MLEPLSPHMTELLRTHGLCSAGDLRRCRRKVKRLTHDLPAFDSVWIDALVSQKSLTPYQAELLESDAPEQIALGDYVLIDRLGGRHRSATYLARTKRRKRVCLKTLQLRPEQITPARENLQQTILKLAEWKSPHIVAPLEVFTRDHTLVVVSRYQPGLNLRELLVRRGRFPVRVVTAITRQLLAGMKALREEGVYHGDLRLENVKLSPRGRALLVETGIQNAIAPQLSYVTDLTLEQCEGIAPERVATGRLVDERSELYSLGCLLWQLLAGRPPIKDADPLAKLTAHQQRDIPDVREWAPDVPEKLALAVQQLTRREPEQRPESFEAAARLFGGGSLGDRSVLRDYQAYFLSQAPGWTIKERSSRRRSWPWLVATVASLFMIAVVLQDEGARTELLSLANRLGEQTENLLAEPVENNAPETVESNIQLLPEPDPEGVIRLRTDGEYQLADMKAVGPLSIIADEGSNVTLVCPTSVNIDCESLRLENLQLRHKIETEKGALLVIRSLDLEIESCTFDLRPQSDEPTEEIAPSSLMAVAWKSIDPEDRSGGRVQIQNCVLAGGGSQLYFGTSPNRWIVKNCLSVGGQSFARFRYWPAPEHPLEAEWSQICLRGTDSALIFDAKENSSPVSGELRLTAENCVFDLTSDRGALFLFHQDDVPDGQFSYLSLIGEDCVASESLIVAGRWNAAREAVIPLEAERLTIEGLILSPVQYQAEMSIQPAYSVVTDVPGPRLSSRLPGIDPEKLPRILSGFAKSDP